MQKNDAIECYELLEYLANVDSEDLNIKYRQLRDLLERICKQETRNTNLQMTDLAGRISYIASAAKLSPLEHKQLHLFRLTSNDLLNHRKSPDLNSFFRDYKTVAQLVEKLSGIEPYESIKSHFLSSSFQEQDKYELRPKYKRLRVTYESKDDDFLYVYPTEEALNDSLKVAYNYPDFLKHFADTIELLHPQAQLNLLNVAVSEDGLLLPQAIVFEPDYLIDISSLAESFKEYGHEPQNYIFSRLSPAQNSIPLILGNFVNFFLDELVHNSGDMDYTTTMKEAFKRYSLQIVACDELKVLEKERQFAHNCKLHFNNLKQMIHSSFQQLGYQLDKSDAVIEPSFICEALGLQGRLDYMQRDMSAFIEMKSGKADEYAVRGKKVMKENHKVQMLLYQAVLHYTMDKDVDSVKPYLLYTKYPLLYPAGYIKNEVFRAINLRNRIVATDFNVQYNNNIEDTREVITKLTAEVMNKRELKTSFFFRFLKPDIDSFLDKIGQLSELEQHYYYTIYQFIVKELFTSKSGDADYETKLGASSLWLTPLDDKCSTGEFICDLTILENHATDLHKAYVTFKIPKQKCSPSSTEVLPNFRLGDIVLFYQRNNTSDNVTNKMVFKGNVEAISSEMIRVRLRATQQNEHLLPSDSLYAIEHDYMDASFTSMFKGLSYFSDATSDRRDLLLSQREPLVDKTFDTQISSEQDVFKRIALKTLAAKDLFLLVGPPGTGKTSCALKQMVTSFYEQEETQILLMAYTNRAVDEICESISKIEPSISFIRVGSELTCTDNFRCSLLENKLEDCSCRKDVEKVISSCRVFVGTTSAFMSKPDLFKIKTFDVAIIDEASQILEPQLLGLLTIKGQYNKSAIQKFVLIGDHKQLPAVVLQDSEASEINDELLLDSGISNLKDSLFERLYRKHKDNSRVVDTLKKQGRMHPEIARFPNENFYGGNLEAVGLPHQEEESLNQVASNLALADVLSSRVAFLSTKPELKTVTGKSNSHEAKVIRDLVHSIYTLHESDFDSQKKIGIITPYRSQIAEIKKELQQLSLPILDNIMVDTVERFQGSQRDIIIYSFSVNHLHQLHFLSDTIMTDGQEVDRKLNVALTRAKRQLIIVGNETLLKHAKIYRKMIDFIKTDFLFKDCSNY